MRDVFTPVELKRLMEEGSERRVSLYMPTHRSGAGYKENQTRLKNLIRKAEVSLAEQGLADPKTLTGRARPLIQDPTFWEGRRDGLAMFMSKDTFEYYRLPFQFDELVTVSGRYHIKPLVRFLADSGLFFILCLSQNELEFFQASRYALSAVELPEDVPLSLDEAMKYDQVEYQLQFHTKTAAGAMAEGKRGAMFHGQGAGIDETKDQIKRFFQMVARGLNKALPDRSAPLVLAGMDPLRAIYREVNTYPGLMDGGVSGNYKDLSENELLSRAWLSAEEHFRAGHEAAAEKYGHLLGTGRSSAKVEEIVAAAPHGRVESLFVAVGRQLWGSIDHSGEAHYHKRREPGDFDLLDYAAGQALASGAAVYAVAPEKVPGGELMAAVFRY